MITPIVASVVHPRGDMKRIAPDGSDPTTGRNTVGGWFSSSVAEVDHLSSYGAIFVFDALDSIVVQCPTIVVYGKVSAKMAAGEGEKTGGEFSGRGRSGMGRFCGLAWVVERKRWMPPFLRLPPFHYGYVFRRM